MALNGMWLSDRTIKLKRLHEHPFLASNIAILPLVAPMYVLSLDASEIESTHADYLTLQRVKAENRATLQKMAEDASAKIAEANRRYEEQMRASQEELERMRGIYDAILRGMARTLMPTHVAEAFTVLGLSKEASFDQVRQQYRILAKRHHPDSVKAGVLTSRF